MYQVSEKAETFRKFRTLLTATIDSYNDTRRSTRSVEHDLIESELAEIDSMIFQGESEFCWRSDGLSEYIVKLEELVNGLWKRVRASQTNIDKIKLILEPWTKMPLFERKDCRKDTLLCLDERQERVSKRYTDVKKAAEQIHSLLEENKKLFQINDIEKNAWKEYVKYVDDIVIESLRKAVGCTLGYLADNMDSSVQNEPLLEAKLELREPDLYYVPSLEPDDPDGLEQLTAGLLNDIIGMATLIPRLKADYIGYAEELENDSDVKGMKNEILESLATAIDEATDFCGTFEGIVITTCRNNYQTIIINFY